MRRPGRLRRYARTLALTALALAVVGAVAAWPGKVGAAPGAHAGSPSEAGGAGPSSAPPRVITLAPHATEMVYAAGGGNRIVGTVTSSDYPEAARSLPRIGDGIQLNAERLIVLEPTVLVAWLRSGAALQTEALAQRIGARMVYSRPLRLRDIPADVRRLGALLGTEDIAQAAAAAMEERISALETHYAGQRTVKVFIEVGSNPLYTIGSDPLVNDAMRICGAVNVYGTSVAPAPRVPVEGVLLHDPQIIVAPARPGQDARAMQARWAGYGLEAAAMGRIHVADPDALFRPGPRFIDATADLCRAVDGVRRADEK